MIDNQNPKCSEIKRYEVDAAYPSVRSGENVIPDTCLGRDRKTREMVKAGCFGRVLSVGFCPIDRTYLITIDRNDYLG
jgi:hypothetical protein